MGIKNLFTKEKKEVDEATRELQKEIRKMKRERIAKELKTLGTAVLAAYGLGTIIGEVIVGIKMAKKPNEQKEANKICNRLLNGRADEYESMVIATGPKKGDGKYHDVMFAASTDKDFGKDLFEELSNLNKN